MRTFESNNFFWVAIRQQLVGPHTGVGFIIINQPGVTISEMRFSVNAFRVRCAARVTVWIQTKLVQASRRAKWGHCKQNENN